MSTRSWSVLVLAAGVGACAVDEPAMGGYGGGKADGVDELLAELYCEPDTGVCIVEGDIAVKGVEGARRYYGGHGNTPGALTVFRQNDVDHLWNKVDRFQLTYCVSSTEFTAEEHRLLVEAMAGATAEWERVAHVDFRHVPEEDARCTIGTERVRFAVVNAPADAPYIARAFFPHYERNDQAIRMSFPQLDYLVAQYPEASLVGIMRHELGHTLGFRHEHIRPENYSWCKEDDSFRPITEYDRRSTMHYPYCDGEGDWSLQISELDAVGAAFFYPNFDRYRGERCAGAELRADGRVDASCEPVVHEILELANTASFEVLDTYVRLDRRAVETIVADRATRPFTTLAALEAVPYIGPVSVRRMYDHLYATGRCPGETDLDGLVDTRCRPIVHRLLELANTASQRELDDVVKLDSRAAANIVAAREQRAFTSLVELWAVPYVKTTALRRMYEYLY